MSKISIIIVLMLSIFCFAPAVENKKTYEIETSSVGEYKTDASRAIEAYERLMDKYMSLNETYLANMSKEISVLSAKLDGVNHQLLYISEKLNGIESSIKNRHVPPQIPSQRPEPQIFEPSQ